MSDPLPIVGLIFFSMLADDPSPEYLSQAGRPIDERERLLFSEMRLDARQALFEAITLPSLDSQTNRDFRVVVIASDRLPQKYRDRLDALSRARNYLAVRYFPPSFSFPQSARVALTDTLLAAGHDPSGRFLHFRLDDDDAVANDFIARLRETAQDLSSGQVISFVNGLYVRPDIGDTVSVASLVYPKISIGLAMLTDGPNEMTIFDFGDHYHIDDSLVVKIEGEVAWLRSVHSAADSQIRRDPFEVHTRREDRRYGLDDRALRSMLWPRFAAIVPSEMRRALRLAEPVNPAARKNVKNVKNVPTFDFPEAEANCLRRAYSGARVILEYGCGGATILASRQPGKRVFTVESDSKKARTTQLYIDLAGFPSPASVYHVDIGRTAHGGRPLNDHEWRRFPDYPLAIWDEPFFRHPDVILIDGRFRAACLATACLRISRPVTVLFDDYCDRPHYQDVEVFAQPMRKVGRMAVFNLVPRAYSSTEHAAMIRCFQTVSVAVLRDETAREGPLPIAVG